MKIKLKPIELDAGRDGADGGYYVSVPERRMWNVWIPGDWAEPLPEPIKPGTLCLFFDSDDEPRMPATGFYADIQAFAGRHIRRMDVHPWIHAKPVTPADLRRWAGEEDDDE